MYTNGEKITVVTVTYNCENIIEKTVKSVIGQTYKNIEYIIVDGKSSDSTLLKLIPYESQISKIISEQDKGIYDAMNKALRFATGDWIIFMNAGDVFCNNKVIAKCFAEKKDNYAVVFGSWYCKSQKNIKFCDCNNPFYENKRKFKSMGFCHQSVFVRLEWARKFPFDLSYRLCADYNMIYQIYQNGGNFYNTHFPICIFDATDGASQKNRILQHREHGRVLGIENTSYFIMIHMIFKLKQIIKRILGRK